jgi:hypothetical protein
VGIAHPTFLNRIASKIFNVPTAIHSEPLHWLLKRQPHRCLTRQIVDLIRPASSSIPATHSENHSAQPILAVPAGGSPDIPDSEMKIPEHPAMCRRLYTLCSVVASLNTPHPAPKLQRLMLFSSCI